MDRLSLLLSAQMTHEYESSVTKFSVIHKYDLFRSKNNNWDELCMLVIHMTHLEAAVSDRFSSPNLWSHAILIHL